MKVYFRNLDGIRFFAAWLVLLHHAFFFKKKYAPGLAMASHMLEDAGRMGVNLFFVLSGFLISYLMLVERDGTGTIRLGDFYIRRMLRIWPLYLVYGLCITMLGPIGATYLGLGSGTDTPTLVTNLAFLLLFAVNVQLAFMPANSGIFEISWSVCIEEQFYLLWPLVMLRFRRHLLQVAAFMFLLRLVLRLMVVWLPSHTAISYDTLLHINYLLLFDKLDLFGGGMLVALFWYQKERWHHLLHRLLHPVVQVVVISITLMYLLNLARPSQAVMFYADHLISVVLFGYLLLAVISPRSILNLEHPLLRTLGKISYGIYLFHTAICQVVFLVFKKFFGNPHSLFLYDVAYPIVCTVLTCLLSYLSYQYFEKYFLMRKQKFAIVTTRT